MTTTHNTNAIQILQIIMAHHRGRMNVKTSAWGELDAEGPRVGSRSI
jgi:hypothetical protein